jgi:hypothetical protein
VKKKKQKKKKNCAPGLISHKVFLNSFCKIRFPHKFVNKFFILVIVKNMLADSWGSRLLQNDFKNTQCEIRHHQPSEGSKSSLSTALMGTTSRQIPASAPEIKGLKRAIWSPDEGWWG